MPMAMELNTKTTEKIKDQVQKERNIMFLAIKLACVIATVLFTGYSLYAGFAAYQAAEAAGARRGDLEREYQQLKAEADAWHEENDSKPDAVTDEGEQIEYKTMYSAYLAGIEVAALQNRYYLDKGLMRDDRERLNSLIKSTDCWIGGGWDPAEINLEWEFVTFYDYKPDASSVAKAYDVAWECWHVAPSGTRYLIMAVFGSYNVETESFKMSGVSYQTDFARMLEKKGAVEAGEAIPTDPSIGQIAGQLVDQIMDSGGTGTIPEDDAGVSAGVLQGLETDDSEEE